MAIINKTRNLLSNNIVYFRLKNNWSQEELAYRIKSSTQYISDIENAKRNVSTDFIERLVNVFKIEPHELLLKREKINSHRIDVK